MTTEQGGSSTLDKYYASLPDTIQSQGRAEAALILLRQLIDSGDTTKANDILTRLETFVQTDQGQSLVDRVAEFRAELGDTADEESPTAAPSPAQVNSEEPDSTSAETETTAEEPPEASPAEKEDDSTESTGEFSTPEEQLAGLLELLETDQITPQEASTYLQTVRTPIASILLNPRAQRSRELRAQIKAVEEKIAEKSGGDQALETAKQKVEKEASNDDSIKNRLITEARQIKAEIDSQDIDDPKLNTLARNKELLDPITEELVVLDAYTFVFRLFEEVENKLTPAEVRGIKDILKLIQSYELYQIVQKKKWFEAIFPDNKHGSLDKLIARNNSDEIEKKIRERNQAAIEFQAEAEKLFPEPLISADQRYGNYFSEVLEMYKRETEKLQEHLDRQKFLESDGYTEYQRLMGIDVSTLHTEQEVLDYIRELKSLQEWSEKNQKAYGSEIAGLKALPSRIEVAQERLNELRNNPESRTAADKLRRFNLFCEGSEIPPFNDKVKTVAEYEAERKRLSEAVQKKIIGSINGRLAQASNTYMAEGEANIWGTLSFDIADVQNPTYNLDQVLNSFPPKLTLTLDGVTESRPFLGDTSGYLVNLVFWITAETSRATKLSVYGKPQDYLSVIENSSFRDAGGVAFDTKKLRDMLLKDGAQEVAAYTGERNAEKSVYAAARFALQQLMRLPEAAQNPNPTPEDIRINKEYNCFPLAPEDASLVAPQEKTYQWIKKQLGDAGFKEHDIELAFRIVMAHCRHTALEEYFDIRPMSGGKTLAVRSMSRLFHAYEWALNSVTVKGSGRDPVALEYAKRHPAFGLPAEKIWLVNVVDDTAPGRVKKMQVYEVIKQGLWDKVVDMDEVVDVAAPGGKRKRLESDHNSPGSHFSDNPTQTYHQHMHYAMVHYEYMMFEKDALPDPTHLASIEPSPTLQFDRKVATKLFNINRRGRVLRKNVGKYFLDRLYLFNDILWGRVPLNQAGKALLLMDYHSPEDHPAAGQFKDGADYYFDNTPKHEAIFRELFASADDPNKENPEIMEAIRNNDKNHFVFMVFWYLVRANLEKWRISSEVVKEFDHKWKKEGDIDYQTVIRTVARKSPLTWPQRNALKMFLRDMQSSLPPELARRSLTAEQIDKIFKLYNIEGNAAVWSSDLKWLLFDEKNKDWKQKIKVQASPLGDNRVSHFLAAVGDILSGDEYRT